MDDINDGNEWDNLTGLLLHHVCIIKIYLISASFILFQLYHPPPRAHTLLLCMNNSDNSVDADSNPSLFRVKLRKGLIGLPAHYREHVRSLGLRRTHQKSYLEVNPQVLGNILKVKELLEVKPVKGRPAANASYWAKGYSLIKRTLL